MCTGSQFQEDLLSHGGIERVTEVAIDSRVVGFVIDDAREIPGISRLNNFKFSPESITAWRAYARARGRVQGVGNPPPPLRRPAAFQYNWYSTKKKNYVVYWCWSSGAPPPKKILDPPLLWSRE